MTGLKRLAELKEISSSEAKDYCADLRKFLIESVLETGGHLASNLGIVEISVALARQMDLPREKIVYDTGHQAYIHKILTGRGEAFSTLRRYGGISGFPRRSESEFDAFGTGHSGTALSAALGFARSFRLKGEDGWSVAVIGDGSFTGGMAFEALNNVRSDDKIIIILNDNGMSISKSVGRLKNQLNNMRTESYYRFKGGVKNTLSRVPLVGESLAKGARVLKNSVKRSALPMGNVFEQYGLHYFGPADGNDLETVEFLLQEAKKKARPAILHLCTKKGCGYGPAEEDPSRYHGISPRGEKKDGGKSNSAIFGECLSALAAEDERIVGITAAMCDGVGMTDFACRFPDRFFDVGIAEEHAMTFAAALAAGGQRPCFAVYSTFYQRAVDQLLHDAALQKLPVTVCLDRAGISGEDGATHHGLFDLPLTLPIPRVKIYSPVTEGEMMTALKSAFGETEAPSVIRYAKGAPSPLVTKAFPCKGEVEWVDLGEGEPAVTAVTFGRITETVLRAAIRVSGAGVPVRVVRFFMLKGFDEAVLSKAFSRSKNLLFVEEGVEIGGFSRYLSGILEQKGILCQGQKKILAVGDGFVSHGNTKLLLSECGLGEDNIGKELISLAET